MNDRQPGAELARMLRPLMEIERKRRAWEQQQRTPIRPPEPSEPPAAKRGGKKQKPSAMAQVQGLEPDLFGPSAADSPGPEG